MQTQELGTDARDRQYADGIEDAQFRFVGVGLRCHFDDEDDAILDQPISAATFSASESRRPA